MIIRSFLIIDNVRFDMDQGNRRNRFIVKLESRRRNRHRSKVNPLFPTFFDLVVSIASLLIDFEHRYKQSESPRLRVSVRSVGNKTLLKERVFFEDVSLVLKARVQTIEINETTYVYEIRSLVPYRTSKGLRVFAFDFFELVTFAIILFYIIIFLFYKGGVISVIEGYHKNRTSFPFPLFKRLI